MSTLSSAALPQLLIELGLVLLVACHDGPPQRDVPSPTRVSAAATVSPSAGLSAPETTAVTTAPATTAPSATAPSATVPSATAPSATAPPPAVQREAQELTWHYPTTALGEVEVAIHVPAGTTKLPVLIALHGWGEALKGPKRGARGWFDDYWMTKARGRLAAPPLTEDDFQRFVAPERLAKINATLEARPYGGLIVVCPYTPKALLDGFGHASTYATFLVDELLPRVYRETPALTDSTGIDGVSLGGRTALLVGFDRPDAFRAVASLQAAFYERDVRAAVKRATRAFDTKPTLKLRMLTSEHDGYRGVNQAIARRLQRAGIEVQLDDVLGPHTYAFNRGPGVYEMLLFHDRALRGLPYP